MLIEESTNRHELEQAALDLMLYVSSTKEKLKMAKKEIDALLRRIEELKKEE